MNRLFQLVDREDRIALRIVSRTLSGVGKCGSRQIVKITIYGPDEALDITLKANPELDRESARLSLLFAIDAMMTKASEEKGLGYMEEDRMTFQIKLMSDLMKFTLPKDVYTNQFIQKKSVTVPPALAAELKKLP